MCRAHACRFIPLAPYKSALQTGTELNAARKEIDKVGFLSLSEISKDNATLDTVDQWILTPNALKSIIFPNTNTPDSTHQIIIKALSFCVRYLIQGGEVKKKNKPKALLRSIYGYLVYQYHTKLEIVVN